MLSSLTERQRQVVELAAKGLSNDAIGRKLCIETRSVEKHTYDIYRKLGIKNSGDVSARTMMVYLWVQRGEGCPGHADCNGVMTWCAGK